MTDPARPHRRLLPGLGLEPGEGRRLALMGTLIGLLCCAYTIAKVLRDALFLVEFGSLALPYAYVAVAVGTVALVWIESRWMRWFPRLRASTFHPFLAIGCSVAAALAYPHAHRWTTALFYVWTGSQAMMLLPLFWGLALDLWDSRRARHVFPVLAGYGLIGGLAGGAFAGWATPLVHQAGLMWSLPVLLVTTLLLTRRLEHRNAPVPHRRDPGFSAWKVIRRSRYIVVFVVALALSVIVGTLVDFQFKTFLHHRYPDPRQLTEFLGRFYVGLNALSLLFQFGIAGWLLQRFGLGVSTGLQPAAVLALASWAVFAPGMWIVTAMRWNQGVLSQTLGKSSSEIYYTAIRPSQRRRIKPAIDTIVERWSDAAVGVMLVVLLHVLHLPMVAIAIVTACFTVAWLAMLFALDRQYGRAFHQLLSSRWLEPEEAPEVLQMPAARRALLEALHAADRQQIILALRLIGQLRDSRIDAALRECLSHPSPDVRAEAVTVMEARSLADPGNLIHSFLSDPHEGLRHAAARYLLVCGPDARDFARGLLEGTDTALRQFVVDILFEVPCDARAVLTPEWIDARMAIADVPNLLLAARAVGALAGPPPLGPLRTLLECADPGVRRSALRSAARSGAPELLDVLLPMLLVPGLHAEARSAVASIGDPAASRLASELDGAQGLLAQSYAANTLAQIGTTAAVQPLEALARRGDTRGRHLALRALARVRARRGRPVLKLGLVHRLFLRELGDYRDCLAPAAALATHPAAEVRLLAESYRESADMALERALQALACSYEPEPLVGVLERLGSRDRLVAAPALEFLEHVLPRAVFRPVRRIFEAPIAVAVPDVPLPDPLAAWIEAAWKSPDGWLRACAVRASRFSPTFDSRCFHAASDVDLRVHAEIEALASSPVTSGTAPC